MLTPALMLTFVRRGPDLGMDWEKMEGHPFAYYTYGVCCSEVELDCLSGDYRVRTQPYSEHFGLVLQAESMFARCVLDLEDRHGDGHREKRESVFGHRPGLLSRQELNKNLFSGGSMGDFSGFFRCLFTRLTDRRRVHAGFGSLHSGGAQVFPLRSALHAGAVSV